MEADKMKEIFKHFPDLENGWKEMEEKLKAEPAEREMLSLKCREMLQREGSKESLGESEFTKAKMADSDLKVIKANAPEKLYITNDKKRFSDKLHSASTEKYVDDDIEYTRTDAFIEKACEYISEHIGYYMKKDETCNVPLCPLFAKQSFIENFKNYMKGE